MKNPFLIIALTGILFSCKHEEKKEAVTTVIPTTTVDSMLITDSTWGPIDRFTDFEGLKRVLGDANVRDMRVCGPECIDSIDITVLFPGSKNSATVYWREGAYHKTIERIYCYMDSADWRSFQDIKIGDGISELLALNGRKISFLGFSWDYGGSISSYNQGALEKSPFVYTLTNSGNDGALDGDIELDTDMPQVKKNLQYIRINSLGLILNRAEH